MTVSVKLRPFGNSAGVILPKDVLARLRMQNGDEFVLTETRNGLHLSVREDDLSDQIEKGREFMKAYRQTFRELAK